MDMIPITLREVAEWTRGRLVNAEGNEKISGVSTDSRKICQGDLFVALKGERFDGHDFVADAIQKGATAILVARQLPFSIPQIIVADTLRALGDIAANYIKFLRSVRENLSVIAVTGSSGKTTTKAMIASIVQSTMPAVVSPESFNNEVGVPLTILQATPEHKSFVLEYAMRKKGDIKYLCRIAPPDIAVITNIGTAHIGLLGSRQEIAKVKAEILGDWGLGADGKRKDYAEISVLPADDDFFGFLRERAKGKVITFGFSPNSDVRAINCQVNWEWTLLSATDGKRTVSVKLPILGEHNARNALAALAVAKALDIDWDVASKALESFQPPKMRLQRQWLDPPGCWVINDAYNANPDSVKAALRTLRALPAKRKVAVLGEMLELGEFHQQGHYEVGQVAAETVDFLIVVGENAFPIAEGAESCGMANERIVRFETLEVAKERWRKFLMPEDLVLLKASRAIGLERLIG
ncbi:MAG: UDP-N-acetylmuramoyl-tripeptide--D-alanyl-D-alanine ligase [Armatimonadetes bacterium]|nr:UDP-N-acetylmuramoyl-tripeptide--D-alanyl-D-alanine ligase [Armatimonadota bacterium]